MRPSAVCFEVPHLHKLGLGQELMEELGDKDSKQTNDQLGLGQMIPIY